jgi:hypothetical protein
LRLTASIEDLFLPKHTMEGQKERRKTKLEWSTMTKSQKALYMRLRGLSFLLLMRLREEEALRIFSSRERQSHLHFE